MTTPTERLLPCPFCGGTNPQMQSSFSKKTFWVFCSDCGLEAPSETGMTAQQAVKYWNRRATLPDPAKRAAALSDLAALDGEII